MVFVPAGCFWMGSSVTQADEQPVHEKCFEKPFWIDRYEVSMGQFDELDGKAEYLARWVDEDTIPLDELPLLPRTDITWEEARAYCVEQRDARLPTEAEWEYAARGPHSLKYPWGNDFDVERVHAQNDRDDVPLAVDAELEGASWVGAAQMSGNVAEWVFDVYFSSYTTDSSTTLEVADRVYRGGAYRTHETQFLTTTDRSSKPQNGIESLSDIIGFRCARDSDT
jgi:formylglycine-generating enzyme required for sulfatase activity